MNSRIRFATCTIICCLLLAMVASVATAVPFKIYDENGPSVPGTGGSSWEMTYVGAVVGDTCYIGQTYRGALLWGIEQVGSPRTALLQEAIGWSDTVLNFDDDPAPPGGSRTNWSKCSLPLGNYIYSTSGYNDLRRNSAWNVDSQVTTPQGSWAPDCICTDGTYIYATQGSAGHGSANGTNIIYKLSVNEGTNTLAEVARFSKVTTPATRFRGVSYYNGNLYVCNANSTTTTGGEVYSVDIGTGTFTLLASVKTAAANHYECVRYGDNIYMVGLNGNLYTLTLSGGVWSLTSTDLLPTSSDQAPNPTLNLYGIGVKGDGTNAKYAWVSHRAKPGSISGWFSKMSFWDLDPWGGTPANLSAPRKNGYPVYVQAVVTAQGAAGVDFWVENQERTMGAHVLWTGAMPALGKLVTIQAPPFSKSASGEKTLTPTAVTEGATADPEVEPVFVTNKSMGLATGGAGMANDGLLVTICGKVTNFNWTTSALSIDDGSRVPGEAAGVIGVKTLKADGTTLMDVTNIGMAMADPPSCYAKVTGIARLEKLTDGTIIRRIDARSTADIVITAL